VTPLDGVGFPPVKVVSQASVGVAVGFLIGQKYDFFVHPNIKIRVLS
jgi:hypothetical protein